MCILCVRVRAMLCLLLAGAGLTGVAALSVATPAIAAVLTVQVTDASGNPVEDAVVLLKPAQSGPAAPAGAVAPADPRVIDQVGEQFAPLVTILPKGGEVTFRNSDVTRHHVYSFSPAKPFELQVAPDETSVPLGFETEGVVALGCNIHDQMVAWIFVAGEGTPVRTGKDGIATFADAPDGGYRVTVWHPRLRPGQGEPALDVMLSGSDRQETVTLRLLPQRRQDRERSAY